jgi:hypothetical protein
VTRNHDFFVGRGAEVAGEVILHLRQGDFPGWACRGLRARPWLGLSR